MGGRLVSESVARLVSAVETGASDAVVVVSSVCLTV